MLKQGFLAPHITFRIGIALKNLANRVGNPCLCTLQWVVYVGSVDVIGLSLWGGSHVLCAFEMSKQRVHRTRGEVSGHGGTRVIFAKLTKALGYRPNLLKWA